jgi:hypothetical protein
MRSKASLAVAFLVFAVVLFPGLALAQGGEDAPKWHETLSVSADMTGIFQGTSGNDYGDYKDRTDFAYSAEVGVSTDVAEGQSFNIILETGDGDGANDNIGSRAIPNYDSFISNIDGEQRLNVSQAFFDGEYFDGGLKLKIGKMDYHALTDTNAYANSEKKQFLNGLFVRSYGVVLPEHTNYYAYTIAAEVTPIDLISLIVAYGKGDTEDFFNKGMTAVQLGIHPKFGELEGNYRVIYIQHDTDYTDHKTGEIKSDKGFIVSVDQAITEDFGLFVRYAATDDTLVENQVKSAISGGIQIGGGLWNRKDDALGVAYGKLELNKNVVTELNEGESVAEAYYRLQLADRVGVSLDGQFFSNLERAAKRDVAVYSLRTQVEF